MDYTKRPLSLYQQVEKLKSRGLLIDDEQLAERYLSNISYSDMAALKSEIVPLIEIERCCDYEALTDVWLASVKATHDFLSEEDIEFYHERIPALYMPNVDIFAIKSAAGKWCAFIGLSVDNIEMLFVHPDEMGKGYGSSLLKFAVGVKCIRKVDVNRDNFKAFEFYQKHGFQVIGASDTDGEGKPYPILHLELLAASL